MKKFFNSIWFTIIFLTLPIIIIVLILIFSGCSSSYNKDNYDYKNNNDEKIEKITENDDIKSRKITSEERELLARLVSCEASICSDDCKRAVISVVFNRLDSGKWGNSIDEVVFYPNAFTPATSGKIHLENPNQKCYDAVDYVVKNGVTLPTEVRYFRDDKDFDWKNYKNYKVIDNMYFGYFENWKEGEW